MPSSFTPLLKLELPATGELSGTWGTTVNNAITTPLSEAIAGTTTITVGGSDYTLTNGDGSAANEARKMFIVATGTPGASRNVICPAASKFYVFRNDTNQTLTLKTLSGTGIAVPAGQYRFLYCNGTDVVETFNAMASLTLGTALAAASGGTGQAAYTTGDLLYATGATALSKLGIGTNGQILTSTGTAPQWSTLSGVAVTTFSAGTTGFTPNSATSGAVTLAGTLATTNGGTGLTSFTANGVVYASSGSTLATGSALTFDGTKALTVGTGTATQRASITLDGGANAGVGAFYGINVGGSTVGVVSSSGYAASDTSTDLAVYGDTGKAVRFYANGSEQMRLTSTGLGIGTSSPTQKLTVSGNAAFSRIGVNANAIDTTSTAQSFVRFQSTGGDFYVGTESSTAGLFFPSSTAYAAILYNANATPMQFYTSSSLRMTLDSSGNLGLGVTPSAWAAFSAFQALRGSVAGNTAELDLSHNAYYDGAWKYIANGFATNHYQSGGAYVWRTAPSGTAGNTISFTQAMTLDASGNLGVGTTSPGYRIHAVTTDGYAARFTRDLSTDVHLDIGADNDGAILQASGVNVMRFFTGATERARITSGGNLLVGTTSDPVVANIESFAFERSGGRVVCNGKNADTVIDVNQTFDDTDARGAMRFFRNETQVGSISVSTTATAYNTSSDYRLKDNPQPLTGSGTFIDALQPKTWNWKETGNKGVGFIAHEVQAVSPGSVVGEKDAVDEQGKPIYQAMEYGAAEFIANIVAEVQSLRARVAALETH